MQMVMAAMEGRGMETGTGGVLAGESTETGGAFGEDAYRARGLAGTTGTMGLNVGFSTQTSFLGEDSDQDPFAEEEAGMVNARRERVAGIVQSHIQGQVSGKPEGYDGSYAPTADQDVSTKLFHGGLMQAVEAKRDGPP